jgi:outer membrane protein TolC
MKKILIVFSVIFGIIAYPAEAKSYNLENLIEILKQQNLLLKIHEIENTVAEKSYYLNRLLPNPEVELSRGSGETFAADIRSVWEIGLKISVPNPIYRHFFLKSEKQSITRTRLMSEIRKRMIIREFKRHYYRYHYYQTLKSLFLDKHKALAEMSRIIKTRVSVGEARDIDYLRSSVELQKNRSNLFKNRKRLLYEKARINEFLNNSLTVDSTFVNDIQFSPLPEIEITFDRIAERIPLIRLKNLEVNQRKLQHHAARYSFIESFNLFASKAREVDADIWRVGVGIKIPVFDTKHISVRKASLELEKAGLELKHLGQHFSAEITRIVSEIRILEKEIETFRGAILIEGRENRDLSRKLYKAGEISLVVFLDSQNSYVDLMDRYHEAVSEWNILIAELEAIMGVEL